MIFFLSVFSLLLKIKIIYYFLIILEIIDRRKILHSRVKRIENNYAYFLSRSVAINS